MNCINNSKNLLEVENIIGYIFNDKNLLSRAFTHSSYANENKNSEDYERLEFLGDAILEYLVSLYLFETYPSKNEGSLSKMRANLVSAETLSAIIDDLGLINYVKVGSGNASENILKSEDVKCDIFEAIVGAIHLDSNKNIDVVKKFVFNHIEKYVNVKVIDYTTSVYEYCAKNNSQISFSELISQQNVPYYKIALQIDGKQISVGEGRSKQLAKKNACKEFFIKKFN